MHSALKIEYEKSAALSSFAESFPLTSVKVLGY